MKTGNNEYDNMISGLNKTAWNKILTKEIGQLKSVLEHEVEYCDYILNDLPNPDSKIISWDYADIIENLEYLIHDLYQWPYDYIKTGNGYHDTLNCNFTTLETILKEIKGHE